MDNRYRLYRDSAVELAKTIVIKSVAAANAINQFVMENYGAAMVDLADPTTWKYYMNLAGEYHPTNEVMTVVSMDTQETITFSKENLLLHRGTARQYAYGTRLYDQLVARYPDQEMLILGIIYPVDKTVAIESADHQILTYPPHLVEENEYNLIAKLQAWIDGFVARWVVRGFSVTDTLYDATWMAIRYVYLVTAILTLRLGACKTNEAHSFHVKKYLASHGLNEEHLEYLTLEQSLWLYRNIDYLQHNLGKQENFDVLVTRLMTVRKLPLADYTMRHDLTTMPDEIYPSLAFRKKTLNYDYPNQIPTILTLEQLLDKQDQFARSNKLFKPTVTPQIREVMENSTSNVVATKFLESTVVDYGDGTPYTMLDTLTGHWLYLASNGMYTAYVTVIDPQTDERIPFSAKDAIVMAWYAFYAARGIQLEMVPTLLAKRVQRIPTPTADDLLSVTDPRLIKRQDALDVLSRQPIISPIISNEAFYETCLEIYRAQQLQRGLMAYQEHMVKRAMMQNMVARIYSDATCTFVDTDTPYSHWFAVRNIDIEKYSEADFQTIYTNIFNDATGLSLVKKVSIKDVQRAMVGLFTGLSSYSIQINAEVNGNDLMVSDTPAVRLGDITMSGETTVPVQEEVSSIQEVKINTRDVQHMEINSQFNDVVLAIETHVGDVYLETGLPLKMADHGMSTHLLHQLPLVRFGLVEAIPENDRHIIPVPGIPEYLALTPEQQLDVIDMYNTGLPPVMPTSDYEDPTDVENILRQKILSGLSYDPDKN